MPTRYRVRDYQEALLALEARGMASSGRTMLAAHYSMPNHVATMRHIAASIGFPSDHRRANLLYGSLAGRIRRELGMARPSIELWAIATWGEAGIDDLDEFSFRMRPQLASALEKLGWVDDETAVPTTRKSKRSAIEGQTVTRMQVHRKREDWLRDAKIADALKHSSDGRLRCEVPGCGFDFAAKYGDIGAEYIQVHHLQPLASRVAPTETRLDDLLLICANCHVMVHRDGGNHDVASLIRSG